MGVDERWYRTLFECSPVGIALADEDGLLVAMNQAYCTVLGRSEAELLGKSSRGYTHPDDLAQHAAMEQLMADARARGEQLRVEKRYVRPDGSVRWGWVAAEAVVGPSGERWTMAVVNDTTSRRLAEDELNALAFTDPLTGLLNRRGWRDRLRLLASTVDRGQPLTLAVLDLDNFKSYNDKHGHHAGDDMIVAFAHRLAEVAGARALCSRWGGEEFVLALPRSEAAVAAAVLDELRAAAAAMPGWVTFSAGFSTTRPGESFWDCFDRADMLLYRAKREGRGRALTDEAV
ncbi:diguanylate cyclase domain-containing protein [Actinomycetes bacterium M1A6_2h]